MRYATTVARNVVSFSALIGPFEFERECERPLNLSVRSNSNGPIFLEGGVTVSNNFTKRLQNGFKIGTRDKVATHLR